jgi:hypothetical protein
MDEILEEIPKMVGGGRGGLKIDETGNYIGKRQFLILMDEILEEIQKSVGA